ncbi:MAG: 2-amino-4-hydroxy-6-hydroxymethyldihydropteridine diphosphokinase [Prolixibacteraceae bacterium]|nr:2-amino-4-hydroxy-6-hydroxymethyldihydropteridine diphosphokinase [Prolixibacteraceae bacterium]MDD4754623.1 2-amino-4-hydroxy-6-hydroxymethyldihydropteridine diphosphokinase [Prolixibacteraceae bacterium]
MHEVYLGIGGNIGNKKYNFHKAIILIQKKLGKVTDTSSVYETPPWGFNSEDNFWNMVIKIETTLNPEALISKILLIEKSYNRKRTEGIYTSRKMDIDILYFDNLVLNISNLNIPHPKIQDRLFVLVPLYEIAPGYKHPLLKLTNRELLENCQDKSVITKIQDRCTQTL